MAFNGSEQGQPTPTNRLRSLISVQPGTVSPCLQLSVGLPTFSSSCIAAMPGLEPGTSLAWIAGDSVCLGYWLPVLTEQLAYAMP